MWRLLFKSLRTGVVTTRYPDSAEPAPAGFRGKPVFDAQKCTGRGACLGACPVGAITIEDAPDRGERRWEISYAGCLFCGLCAEACPSGAIAMSSEYELAAKDKDDLSFSATFRSDRGIEP